MESNPLPPIEAQTQVPKPPRSKAHKILLGLGCGCATLLTLSIVGMVWAVNYFLGSPGVQIPSDYVLGPDTNAFVHIASPNDDGPARALVSTAIKTLANINPDDIDQDRQPELYSVIENLQGLDDESISKVLAGFPEGTTVAFEATPTEADLYHFVATMNLPAGSRLLRLMVETIGSRVGSEQGYGEHTIYSEFDSQEYSRSVGEALPLIAFQHDSLLVGSSLEIIKAVLDRTDFEEVPGPPPASPQRASFNELSERWLVSMGAGGEIPVSPGFVAELLAGLPATLRPGPEEDRLWREVQIGRLQLGGKVTGRDLSFRVTATGLDAEGVATVEAGLDSLFQNFAKQLRQDADLELTFESLAGEGEVVLNARLADFETWLRDQLEGLVDL